MKFHFQETMSKRLTKTVHEQLDVSDLFKGRQDVYRIGPLQVDLQVSGHEAFIKAEGELKVDVELACSRCLDPVQEHMVIPFAEMFKQPAAVIDSDEYTEEEISDVIEVDADRLDLRPYVEEVFEMYMPFAPLCKDDCKGLCSKCGQNLNEQPCNCENNEVDSRFAALKDLFKD